MAATPPPHSARAHTPPTPMHGARHDAYEPYSPRRSTRISGRQTHTPAKPSPATLPKKANRPTFRRTSSQTFSPPSSPISPPQSHSKSRQKQPSRVTFDSDPEQPARVRANGAHPDNLPTPVKTPRKRPARSELGSTARVLFANRSGDINDLMPTPRRSAKARQVAINLGSFADEDNRNGDDLFPIYTDSKDRVPEVDMSEENPFVVRKGERRGKRVKSGDSSAPKHGLTKEVDEAVENGEGMVYVFRGRKIYRKFDDLEDGAAPQSLDQEDQARLRHSAGSAAAGRFTRSSIKPRLLFPPTDPHAEEGITDEEAVTDIEAPTTTKRNGNVTPTKHRFRQGPATPPTTVKKARINKHLDLATTPDPPSGNLDVKTGDTVADSLAIPAARRARASFDTWQRTKPGPATQRAVSSSTKRAAESSPEESSPKAPKRSKSEPRLTS